MRIVIWILEGAQLATGLLLAFLAFVVLVELAKQVGCEQPFWWLVGISGGSTFALIFLRDMPAAYLKVFGKPVADKAHNVNNEKAR
jgi:hypothetical protein